MERGSKQLDGLQQARLRSQQQLRQSTIHEVSRPIAKNSSAVMSDERRRGSAPLAKNKSAPRSAIVAGEGAGVTEEGFHMCAGVPVTVVLNRFPGGFGPGELEVGR